MKVKYYLTTSGRSPVEEFISGLSDITRLEIADAVVALESGKNLAMPLSRNLSSIRPGLHELRFRDKAGQVRLLYFIKRSDAIYFVHGFRKKTQEIHRRELEIIFKRLKEI